uniref:Uncharacterized protein n=1 Tax=Tanacetum cinerariifolium TaxID=118510 RepID=A0A699IMS8_TANCI|nr:hypothetical protein [Tanacetum cinerariifolium]
MVLDFDGVSEGGDGESGNGGKRGWCKWWEILCNAQYFKRGLAGKMISFRCYICQNGGVTYWYQEPRVMSSPNHHTSDIEDSFSPNFPDYILASPDYVPASPRKTYSSSSNKSFGLVPIASLTLLLFHDDPYMKVMHAYYAKELPIPPPVIVPPSPMLSPMFNPQEFFLPEELLPPKK